MLVAATLFSCERTRTTDEENEDVTVVEKDTTTVARTGETAEQKLERLRGWMNEKAGSTDTAIRDNWPKTKEELRRINQDLERNVDSLSAESKEEYRQLKERYQRWEERQDRRLQQPLDATQVEQWQEQLLREHKDVNAIAANNMREAYMTFMGTVRAKRRNWTQNDWDYVDYVYSSLNERMRRVEGQIPTADKLKIRTLQAEYLALEGSADTRSMLRN